MIGGQEGRSPDGNVVDPGDVEASVRKGLGTDERAEEVIRLEPDDLRDPGRAVPVLDGPALKGSQGAKPAIGVHDVRMAHGPQERCVEDAVGIGVAPGQIDVRGGGETPDRGQLPHGPGEVPVDPPGVAAVATGVLGPHHVVEADQLGHGGDQVDG